MRITCGEMTSRRVSLGPAATPERSQKAHNDNTLPLPPLGIVEDVTEDPLGIKSLVY